MRRLSISFVPVSMILAGVVAHGFGDGRANELIAQARAALGGESKLAKVIGISAAGTYTRVLPDRQLSGELTIDLQLPDKMLRTESMNPFGDATIVLLQGINGDRVLRNSRTIGGGPNMFIRAGAPPEAGSDAEAQALRNQRAELARVTVAFLLTSPPSMPLEFAYGGEAEAEDGKAFVLDVKGPGTFAAKLFLDQTSHRPLMLAYKGVAPNIVMRTQRGDGPPDPARTESAGKEAARGASPGAPPQPVDINLFFDDYKPIDGVLLPHHISRSIDGKPSEEWTFKTIKVNPVFAADTFSGK
jgi:hypothetical protein